MLDQELDELIGPPKTNENLNIKGLIGPHASIIK